MHDLNYYEILELTPDIQDGPTIERRLQEKQRLWSRQTTEGTPKDARIAARNLKLLDAMRKAMADPAERTSHAARARQQRDERLRDSRSRLTEFLGFAKGRVEDVETFISRDCARFVRELGRDEVRRLMSAAGVTAAPKAAAPAVQRRETLEPATTRRIREGLEHLGKKDLYDFLGLSRRCTARSLRDKADQLNRALLHNGRSDDQTAAAKELAGQCMAVFESEDGRIRYNNTLLDETLENTLKDFLPLAGKDGVISAKSFADLLGIASRQGVPAPDAAAFIRTFAQRKRWQLTEGGEGGAVLTGPAAQPCGYCGCIPQSDTEAFCWNCRRKLSMDCPACGKPVHSSQQHCTACGVSVADAEIVQSLFDEAKQAATDGHAEQALKLLQRCLTLWPQWKEAQTLRDTLTENRRLQQGYSRRLVGLLRERRMCAAQECLEEALRECGATGFSRAAEVISRTMTDANRLFMEGEGYRLEGRSEEAGERFEQALAMCTDLKNAQEALRRMPTPPAVNLRAERLGQTTVRLLWEPGKADVPFAYTLVRKAEGLPGSIKSEGLPGSMDDGKVLLEAATACVFDDTTATGGVNWHYAVFATRRDLPDAPALPVGVGPIFLTPPPLEFTARGDDERALLNWSLPEGAVAVAIFRCADTNEVVAVAQVMHDEHGAKIAESAAPHGVPVILPEGCASMREGGGMDTGLVNGQSYVYTAVALYPDPDSPGRRRSSPSVNVRVTPAPRLEPVSDLCVLLHGDRAYVRLTPPPMGRVMLLVTHETPAAGGGPVPVESLGALGTPLHEIPGEHGVCARPPAGALLLPVTVRGNLALPGIPAKPLDLNDVHGLTASAERGGLSITWDWPEGVDCVRVYTSTTGDPHPSLTGDLPETGDGLRCTRADYATQGACVLAPVPLQKHFVRVCACVPGHESIRTEGTTTVCGMGVVDVIQYRVLRTGFFQKSATAVELSCKTLPMVDGLLLHAREGAVPLNPTDGVTLAMVDRLVFHNGSALIPIPERFRHSKMLVRLFFANPDQAACIRLMPGATEELRLL